MLIINVFRRKTVYWLVAFLSLLLAVFAYATKDRTIVVPQQLVIIPSTVTSDTWRDPEKTQIHEASDYSLYQDFSTDNSAYLDQAVLAIPPVAESISPLPPSTDSELDLPAAEGETGGDTSNEAETPKASSAEPGAPPGELEAIPLEPPESIEAEPVSVTAPEEPTANTEDTTVSALWSSTVRFVRLPLAERLFPLAQEVITTNVTSTKLSTTEPVEMGTEATVESEVPTGEVSDEEVVTEEESSAPETDGGGVESTDGGAVEESTTEKVVADETDQNDVEEVVVEEGEIEEYVTTIADFCAGDEACRLYSANFSGFAMPEFESGTFLTGAQLRLSLAAQALPGKADKPQRFVVEYIYAEGEPWRTATVIDIEDEISNSINGGYFLVSLERPSHQSFLANLKVRVSYQGDIENLKRAYIESLWLEVASAKFYEETDPLFADGAITYDRDLEQPKFHSLNNADLDQVVSKLPAFALSYSPQQGFLRRAFQSLFGDNEYKVDSVRLTDAAGTVLTVPIEVEYFADKTWTLKFLKQPQKLVPGKYRIELVVNENDTLYADAFEFYWGVLAVNTTKSMYFPNEDVALNLAALTEEGDTICDANLQLKIISPDYSIYEVPVEPTGACGKNNVTDNPDYLAFFKQTSEFGRYTVQLKNLNQKGEVVHAVEDFFEVREYIPYDIERTAPTRIYPPAPYKVALHVTAYRSYTGDIVERVPRGFVLTDYGDAEVVTMPEYTELVWRNVELKEGDELNLGYEFDAPDVSPYLYLLGPLNMDGFAELREWQIASDALTSIATFTGTRTVAGTNFNNTASPLQWSTSTIDAYYYTHATSSNSHEVTIRRSGDYFLAVNLPLQRSDANARGTRIGMEVRVNGVRVPESVGRSGYITNQSAHSESSSHSFFLLKDVVPNDVLTVYSEALTTINVADTVVVTGQASLYLELIPTSENVFSATTTRTINSTNLNQITEYSFNWTETRQDTGFTHSDSVNPEQIIIATAGTYLVEANVPLTTDNTNTNIMGRVRLDGVQVLGGQFMQGYAQAPGTESDGDSSIHFSGIFVATTTNQILTLTATREGTTGTVTVSTGLVGSVFVRKLPTMGVIALRGTNLVGGTNWNPAAAAAIQWDDRVANDSGTFTHSTSSNSHQITIASDGDYFLSYNDALTGSVIRANSRVAILKNGTAITGAQAKSHYTRNQNGQTDSSGALVTVLPGLLIGDVITVTTIAEAAAGILDDSTSGVLVMWKKATLNVRPDAPTMYNAPFDNIRFASTTPYFDFSAVDPDGTSSIVYEFSLATTTGFTASSTYNSVVSLEFFNTASSTDTSPFNEGNKIRFQLTGGAALTDLMTYYWRVRAKDITGSGEYGDWSTTQSLTVDMAESAPSWFQSYRGQFEGDTLVGTVSGGGDQIQVDASVSSEILIAYGEGAVTTPRYRFWNGTTWGVEGSAVAVSNTINWVRTAAAVSRNEYAMVTLDASDDAYAQIYSASTSSWGNQSLLSSVVTSAAYRGVAVGYESLSGDVMAISCSNGPNPVYRIWNGSSWSATSSITVSSLNNCNFLELASDPASDEIILVVRDTGTQYEALVWNGSAWVESRVIGSSALVAREGLSVAYEASGDQAMVVVSDNANNNIMYTTWSGTEFGANATQAIGNDLEFARLARDPNSDKLALCYIDTDNDIGVLRWDGGVWSTFTELDTAGNIDTGRPVECAFETLSGRSNYLMAVYSDTTNVRYRTGTSSVYSTEASVGTVEDSFWVQAKSAGNGIIMSVSLDDTADDLDASFWNGTTWSAKETLETSPSSIIAAPYEMYDMAAKRFQFSEGRATTPPIDFTSVPNQPTWGDITFSTTEPFGTNVSLRLKYSSSTVCDTYISNGVLPGNGAGFDVNDAPIDITTLSTSTYRQICLEATLTTLGSASALLNDWTLAWVRQPKLAQSNYRWYVNGSFLTPTDPWPTGATDFATNMPLSSEAAVTNGEAIRLRLSLLAKNVASPALAKTFKLQYANGLTCNQSLTWHDVGTTASTTALWRGYKNSIVGDDWYSASWVKRIKLTIPRSMVPGSQTNFPVYVNLDDLPDAFFLGVQADGDDIRVTQSNGITEVPYELVTIDTSAKTGELHFKADVSSTTESKYYIYYGNSGASGYSASATYGRNNVWTNGFLAVYHLDQSPTASTPQFTDSTGNSAGTAVNLEVGDRQTGQVGRAIDFDGTNEYIDTNFNRTMLRSTWSLWLRTDGAQGAYDGLFTSQGTLTNGLTVSGSSTRLGYNWRDAVNTYTWVGAPIYPTNAWFMASLVVEPTQATVYSHTGSGVTSAVNTVTHATATVDGLDIGQDSIGSRLYNGLVDEATLANTVRSATWLATTYNNKANSTGFYSVSSEELINDGRTLPSTILSGSDYPETYEEENPTRENQNALPVGDEAEWDFVLQPNNAAVNTNYCFRMVYGDGSLFNTYTNYPRLITNAPPLAPELYTPFNNERLASTTPWFEFASTDERGDGVTYQIQIDTEANFGSPDVDTDSVSQFALFTNLLQPSQKSEFTSGQRIRFEGSTPLTNGNTYWWRVRSQDMSGSATYSDWSTPHSVTINTATAITTWFQTTGSQLATNNLLDTITSTSTNDIGIDSGFTAGTTTSKAIDYDNRTSGNAWGDLSFTHNVTSGTIRYYVEYLVAGDTYSLVPDAVLVGNSSGLTTSPVSLANLNTTTYNELRLRAVFSGDSILPRLQDWTVTWAKKIEIPTLTAPFDNAKVSTTTPALTFYSIDPESDSIQYELQLASASDFAASSTFTSGVSAGFVNVATSSDTSPFNSGESIRYTVQSALSNGNTYWWRVRARDPSGDNVWSEYSNPQSFTVDTAITVSAWHQSTGDQFATDVLTSVETTAGAVQITTTVNEVLMAYGEGTGQAPRYRLWNGTVWGAAKTAVSVGAQIRWTDLEAASTRSEYALGTIGTDNDVNVQIYNANTDTWGNVSELVTNIPDILQRGFDIAYETTSGKLLAVSCEGDNAVYSVWNGTSWTATSSLSLANTNSCLYVELASDPTSNEIVAVFKHANTNTTDYELKVWSGSAWGNTLTLADMSENANAGAAVVYEASGDQAIVALTNDLATTLLYALWSGTAWSTSTQALGDHLEWAALKRDVGTDKIALCYTDNDTNIGVLQWSGSAWGTFTEIEQIANGKAGQSVDCAFETLGARDGYLMAPYSDATNGRYQFYATSSFNGELGISVIEDSWRVMAVRGGDGLVHTIFFDDTNDRYDTSRWNGTTWSTRETLSATPSITGTPFDGSLSLAARTYPVFTSGSVRSTSIDFANGAGPRWERINFIDITPGSSDIKYRLYYLCMSSSRIVSFQEIVLALPIVRWIFQVLIVRCIRISNSMRSSFVSQVVVRPLMSGR